ncbi:serine carboxypeptidase-like 13 isoform X9 [Brassica napus]|uniref:serine carboxypeptidase-like 13 isoform X5 n=1 Tax=Brassica oleracea var. oleracea TaxID=109376 RepID=UPI0006A6B830|nr:PREDICTED: serine carboxypeptidase-like 13 isoform X5 [Brassica oleracea var. oleracea]XP_013686964.2 serine carboxypeptidase-like 13 isoform X9 [Brassica napus]
MRMRLTLKLLIPVLLVLRYFADSASVVKLLPGFEGPLPFELETGYIGLGEEEEIQMFYYFIKSENNPREDPLLIWLTGGPGCSSIFGLLFENGPLALKFEVYNGSIPSLVSTTYSWTKPVGSGFSYSRTPLVDKISDTGEVKRIHEFLQKWLSKHPKFYANPFYVAGDSYSGMVVPPVVQEISEGNYICCKPLINLQGYILGNPVTDTKLEHNYLIPFAYGMALISEELYESMKRICKGSYGNLDSLNTECLKLTEIYQKCTDRLNKYHILLPDCDKTSPDCHLYKYFLLEKWANNERVHKALHVNKGGIGEWRQCNYDGISYKYDIQSSVPYHKNNSINGFRSLIFSGDHDMTVPFLATQAWIRSLNYSIIDDWRPWMMNDQIAGYTRTYANKMTFATVKGGGHTADYKPDETFIMFKKWISSQPL